MMKNEDTCIRFHSSLAEFTAKKLPQFYRNYSRTATLKSDDIQKNFKKFSVKGLWPRPIPVEKLLEIPPMQRRAKFFQSISAGDVVEGRVTDKWADELLIRLESVYYGPRRWIKDLNIKVQCDLSEFKTHSGIRRSSDSVSNYDIGDRIRGVVCNVNQKDSKIMISFRRGMLHDALSHIELGLIEEIQDDAWDSDDDQTYMESLRRSRCFSNPQIVNNLITELGINETKPSTFIQELMSEVHPDEFGEKLRERQSTKWSMEMVANGVKLFKLGKHEEAMKCFDQALQMHPKNVEGLVARGALKANQNSLKSAIEDFYKALEVYPSHRNGQKYLCETLISLAKQYEKDRNWKEASRRYKEILQVNPSHEEAIERVQQIQLILSSQILAGKLGSVSATGLIPKETNAPSSVVKSRSKSLHELLTEKVSKMSRKEKKARKKSSKKKKKKKHRKKKKVKEVSSESSDTDPDATDSATERPVSTSEDEWVEKVVKIDSSKIDFTCTSRVSRGEKYHKTLLGSQPQYSPSCERFTNKDISGEERTIQTLPVDEIVLEGTKYGSRYHRESDKYGMECYRDDNSKVNEDSRTDKLDNRCEKSSRNSSVESKRSSINSHRSFSSCASNESAIAKQSKRTGSTAIADNMKTGSDVTEKSKTTDEMDSVDVNRLISYGRYGHNSSSHEEIKQPYEKRAIPSKPILPPTKVNKNKHFAPDELDFITQLLSKKSKD